MFISQEQIFSTIFSFVNQSIHYDFIQEEEEEGIEFRFGGAQGY